MAQARSRASANRGTRERPRASASPGREVLCSVPFCPICMAVSAASEARPELIEHLLAASREFLLALRSVIDARLEGTAPNAKLERLTIE